MDIGWWRGLESLGPLGLSGSVFSLSSHVCLGVCFNLTQVFAALLEALVRISALPSIRKLERLDLANIGCFVGCC